MRSSFRGMVALAALVLLSTGASVAGASTKFAYTERVDEAASLVVQFEEGSQKRFASVDYQLDADVVATWTCESGQSVSLDYHGTDLVTLTPDAKGRVSGTLAIGMDQSPGPLLCGLPQHIGVTSVTLTNATSGHVYNLDPITRDA